MKNFIKRIIKDHKERVAKTATEKRIRDMSKITYSRMYVGLSAEDVAYENQHVRTAVLNLIRPSVPNRILHSYSGPMVETDQLDDFNGHKCFKITYWCYSKDQYCIGCSTYGCPGGC